MFDQNFETQPRNARSELNRQNADTALQDSEKRYRRLFEYANDGILILDAGTGKVVDVNPFLLQLLGYSYDEMHGRHLWEIGSFQDIAASKTAFRSLQDAEYIRYDNLPLKTHDGKSVEVEFVSNVYLVDRRKVIQCNIRDITIRKQAERALQESETKMRSILDNIGIGVSLISPKMEILELNRQMLEWFPGIQTDHRPICLQALNDPPGKDRCKNCPTQKTLMDGLVHIGAVQTSLAGAVNNYRIVSSPIRDASGEIIAVIEMVEDITEKLALESQVRQSQKMDTPKNTPTGYGETILVVDDDVAILNLVKSCLQRQGYTVLASAIPGEAIRLAEMHIEKIRLVITDVIMPEMNGRELINRVMSMKPDIKHLFMSGYTADVIHDRGVIEGNGSFIQKPFSMKALAAKVCETLTDNK